MYPPAAAVVPPCRIIGMHWRWLWTAAQHLVGCMVYLCNILGNAPDTFWALGHIFVHLIHALGWFGQIFGNLGCGCRLLFNGSGNGGHDAIDILDHFGDQTDFIRCPLSWPLDRFDPFFYCPGSIGRLGCLFRANPYLDWFNNFSLPEYSLLSVRHLPGLILPEFGIALFYCPFLSFLASLAT